MEFGGYLPIELAVQSEYYSVCDYHKFNSARSALLHLLSCMSFEHVYLPVYLCESVRIALKTLNIPIIMYNISDTFEPMIDNIGSSDVIIITNYYGIHSNKRECVEKYKNVIFDNTQAFFEPPIDGAYNIYSCRKFFGVTDGAYIIGKDVPKKKYNRFEPQHSSYLLDAITYSTNHSYPTSLLNEEQIANSGICLMSELSKRIMPSINYGLVKSKRKENYGLVSRLLGSYNNLNDTCDDSSIPMIYPFLIEDDSIRETIVSCNIYVPQWWKYILNEQNANEFEKKLSKYLLPIPIDQRYNTSDIVNMCNIITSCMEK